jgi:hypothetical protein
MNALKIAVGKAVVAIAPFPPDRVIDGRILELTSLMMSGGLSPVDSVRILSGTVFKSSIGLAGAINEGLPVTDLYDRENLREAIVALRGAAGIFEALVNMGRQ